MNKFNFKVWLCGVTGDNNLANIDEITKEIYKFFDGLIFVCHEPCKDGTRELLESRKGNGELISMPFLNHHGLSYNAVLCSQKILPGDFIVWVDAMEKMNTQLCSDIHNFCLQLMKQNINTVYFYGKVLIFRYFSDSAFTMVTPHTTFATPKQIAIEISTQPGFENIRENLRPKYRTDKHQSIDHFAKYVFQYKHNNNQLTCGRETNLVEIKVKEEIRQKFLVHCVRDLGLELNVESLKNYILNNELKYITKWYINELSYINDLYCYYVLKHDLDDIFKRRAKLECFEIK